MWIIDNDTIPHAPTSKFISKDVYVEVYQSDGGTDMVIRYDASRIV